MRSSVEMEKIARTLRITIEGTIEGTIEKTIVAEAVIPSRSTMSSFASAERPWAVLPPV